MAGVSTELAENPGQTPGAAWESWTGGDPRRLHAWLAPHALAGPPRRIEMRAPSARYGSALRATILDMENPVKAGALSLEVLDERHLMVATENLASFELALDCADLAAKGRILVQIDGRARTLDAASHPRFVAAPRAREAASPSLPKRRAEDPPRSPMRAEAWGTSSAPGCALSMARGVPPARDSCEGSRPPPPTGGLDPARPLARRSEDMRCFRTRRPFPRPRQDTPSS